MKKVLLLVGGMLLINAFINSGFSTPKNNQTTSKPSNTSESNKNQLLNTRKAAPMLLPLLNQTRPSAGNSSNSAIQQSKPGTKQLQANDNTNAANPAPSTNAHLQEATPPTCTADSTGSCTTTSPQADTGTNSINCNLNDPSVPIEQFQQNGTILCP
jgi:hypothetical protein